MTVYCRRCGRELTNEKSKERGYDPVCWRKIQGRAGGVAALDGFIGSESDARRLNHRTGDTGEVEELK